MDFLKAVEEFAFLRNTVLASLLLSIPCGVIGSYIVTKRTTYISGAIAHAVLGGIGISRFLNLVYGIRWFDPLLGAIVFSIFFSLILGWFIIRGGEREDTIIAAMWSLGMSVGILIIYKTPSYFEDLFGYLFGNILLVSKTDIFLILGLDIVILLLSFLFYNQFLLVCFDEEFARSRGLRVEFYYLLLLSLSAVTVVLLSTVAGILMSIALISIPAATANLFIRRLSKMMFLSSVFTVLFIYLGIFLSYKTDLPSGGTTVLTTVSIYLSVFAGKKILTLFKRNAF